MELKPGNSITRFWVVMLAVICVAWGGIAVPSASYCECAEKVPVENVEYETLEVDEKTTSSRREFCFKPRRSGRLYDARPRLARSESRIVRKRTAWPENHNGSSSHLRL